MVSNAAQTSAAASERTRNNQTGNNKFDKQFSSEHGKVAIYKAGRDTKRHCWHVRMWQLGSAGCWLFITSTTFAMCILFSFLLSAIGQSLMPDTVGLIGGGSIVRLWCLLPGQCSLVWYQCWGYQTALTGSLLQLLQWHCPCFAIMQMVVSDNRSLLTWPPICWVQCHAAENILATRCIYCCCHTTCRFIEEDHRNALWKVHTRSVQSRGNRILLSVFEPDVFDLHVFSANSTIPKAVRSYNFKT